MKNRNEYYDFIRGVAIVFVIGIHTFARNVSDEGFVMHAQVLLRQVFNCAVPLFLAISGFFLGRLELSSRADRVAFWKKQIPKIYTPCLLWSLYYLHKDIFIYDKPVVGSIINYMLCGSGVYYFILVMLQLYFLLPFIKRFCNKAGTWVFIALSFAAVLAMNIYYTELRGVPVGKLIATLGYAPLWIGFFALGIHLAVHSKREYRLAPFVILTVVGLSLSFFETGWWPEAMRERMGYKLSAFIFSYGVIMLLFSKKAEGAYAKSGGVIKSALSYVGRISFGIYLMHALVIKNVPSWGWTAQIALTLGIAVAIIAAVKRLIPNFSKKYLGFF